MPVTALGNYDFEPLDAQKNFHGNIITYWNWVDHLMFCAPIALPLAPDMPFAAVVGEVLPGAYAYHPDFEKIDWDAAEWNLDGAAFTPDLNKSLKENGLGHKSVVRFTTPGLTGVGGSYT